MASRWIGKKTTAVTSGIVGLPNAGKSTLFNAMTRTSGAETGPFPFCTIEPNVGKCVVPDERFDWLCRQYQPAKKTPTSLTVTDIAGLVKGAAGGKGLGNKFLSDVRSVDAILHAVRCFESNGVAHVEETVNPARDVGIVESELILKDIESVEKRLSAGKKGMAPEEKVLLTDVRDMLFEGQSPLAVDWDDQQVELLTALQLFSTKPVVYLANVGEDEYLANACEKANALRDFVGNRAKVIAFSAELESKLIDMSLEEADNFLAEFDVKRAAPSIIHEAYRMMNLIHFFTCGEEEVRCWTIQNQSTAPEAGGAIHSDFEDKFIAADVMKFDVLKEMGSEEKVKAAGKVSREGRDYIVEDGDIMLFRAGSKAKAKR